MPDVHIPDATYQRLADRARRAHLSVPELLDPALDALARTGTAHLPPRAITRDEWARRMGDWQQLVQARADRYPPGFRADDGRDAAYEGRGG